MFESWRGVAKGTEKIGCTECSWVGTAKNLLLANNPFREGEISACPHCFQANFLIHCCDADQCRSRVIHHCLIEHYKYEYSCDLHHLNCDDTPCPPSPESLELAKRILAIADGGQYQTTSDGGLIWVPKKPVDEPG